MANRASQNNSFDADIRKEYLEFRKTLFDTQHQVSQSLDSMVVTLAGGALGISFTFIRQIVPKIKPETIVFLGVSWACLVLALLVILFSVFTSQFGMIKAIEEVDISYNSTPIQKLQRGIIARVYTSIGRYCTNCFGWRPLTQILNVFAIILTIVGLALLAWFCIANISMVQLPLSK